MSLTTATGIALILSTLIYHGGLAYLFARAQFGEVLKLPRGEKLLIIAEHPDEYRWGCRIILAGWIVAAVGYVMFAALLRDAGDPIISTLAAVLFLIGIASAVVFWVVSCSADAVGRRRDGPHLEHAGVLRGPPGLGGILIGGLSTARIAGDGRIWLGSAPDRPAAELGWMGDSRMGGSLGSSVSEDFQRISPTADGDASRARDVPTTEVNGLRPEESGSARPRGLRVQG